MINRKFAEWLKEYREQQGMSQSDLANAAGVGRSIISKIEKGQKQTHLATLTKIANALNLSQEFIYQQAGILQPAPADTEYQAILISKFEKLTKSEQNEILDWIDFKLRKRGKNNG